MIVLADTSIWIKHFLNANVDLKRLASAGEVCIHSAIIGELMVGNLPNRRVSVADFYALPRITELSPMAALQFIEQHHLFGKGLSWVDAQLLAASVAAQIPLWTADVRLMTTARQFNLAWTS